MDHLHKNNDAWQIFLTKWSNLFHQSFNKETDGALYDQDIRDIFIDDMTCKKKKKKIFFDFIFRFFCLKIILKQQQQQ